MSNPTEACEPSALGPELVARLPLRGPGLRLGHGDGAAPPEGPGWQAGRVWGIELPRS